MLDEMLENMQHNSSFGIINRESQGAQGNEVVTEMFMAGLDTYVSIMAEWINKGELKDGC